MLFEGERRHLRGQRGSYPTTLDFGNELYSA